MARLAVVGRADGRDPIARRDGLVDHPGDHLRGHPRLVAERHDHPVRVVADRVDATAQRRRHPLAPALAHHGPRLAEVDRLPDDLGVGPEHRDDRVDCRHEQHRVDGMLQQRRAVELGELLAAAEPPSRPGGQHDAGDAGASGHPTAPVKRRPRGSARARA